MGLQIVRVDSITIMFIASANCQRKTGAQILYRFPMDENRDSY